MTDAKTIFQQFTVCNLCGSDDYDVIFEADYAQVARIVKCKKCSLIYANPRAQLVDHANYEQWEPIGLLDGVTNDKDHPYRWRVEKESLQVRDYSNTRATLAKLYPKRGHIVEVGSSLGYLLKSFQNEGWTVQGIDPWREVMSHTRNVQGFETIPATLEEAGLPDACADVVIMLHVIEHVPDPSATLREIYRILKPGGHLVIETPRYDTVTFKMFGCRERSVRQDGHIYFFTTKTLRETYEKVGFSEVETVFVGRSMTADRLLWNVGNFSRSETIKSALKRTSATLNLSSVKFAINLKDMMRVIARKGIAV